MNIKDIKLQDYDGKGVIYKITSPSNKIYIGKSIKVSKRFHSYKANKGGKKIVNALIKYGWDSMTVEIEAVIELDEDIDKARKDLNELEVYYINKYDSFNTGYNGTLGGDGGNGRIVDEEERAGITERNFEYWRSEKAVNRRQKISCKCTKCEKSFEIAKGDYDKKIRKKVRNHYCSNECRYADASRLLEETQNKTAKIITLFCDGQEYTGKVKELSSILGIDRRRISDILTGAKKQYKGVTLKR